MKKFIVFGLLLLAMASTAQAVAIDDSITPQNCSRSDAGCAAFLDTSSNGQIKWGGLVAGGLRSLTNLFVDGKLGIGTLKPNSGEQALRLDVNGAVGAKFYCDESGNHCVAGDALNTGGNGSGDSFWGANGSDISNLNSGKVGVGTKTPDSKLQVVAGDSNVITAETTGQFAYLKLKDQNGTAEISNNGGALVLGGNADSPITFRNSQYQTRMTIGANGRVGIGTDNPTSILEVKQTSQSNAKNGESVAKFTDAFGQSSFIGLNGNGAEFHGNQGVYAYSPKDNGTGITALAYNPQTTGQLIGENYESYGGRFIALKTGVYAKGSIGLYATDLAHTNPITYPEQARNNTIPASLLNSATQWAGWFDGNVNVNGDLNVTGQVKVNGQPIGSGNNTTPTPTIGEQCGIFTDGVMANANVPCQDLPIYKGNGADKSKASSYQCPAKYTLAGGDFQSPGNRYMFTCVRAQI